MGTYGSASDFEEVATKSDFGLAGPALTFSTIYNVYSNVNDSHQPTVPETPADVELVPDTTDASAKVVPKDDTTEEGDQSATDGVEDTPTKQDATTDDDTQDDGKIKPDESKESRVEAESTEEKSPEASLELELDALFSSESAQESSDDAANSMTGAIFLRQVLDGLFSVESDSDAAKFLYAVYKSPKRPQLLVKLKDSTFAVKCFEAAWKHTQKAASFEKRVVRFVNILRMRPFQLESQHELLQFWISHLDQNGVCTYFTHLALTSGLNRRSASTFSWLLKELLKLEQSENSRFYRQCAKDPKIAALVREKSEDQASEQTPDLASSSSHSDDIQDFVHPPLCRTEVEWRKKKLMDEKIRDSSGLVEIMDDLMALTGLEHVKRLFLDTIDQYDLVTKYSVKKRHMFSTTFTGNPGVGKTRIAKLYCRLLVHLMELSEDTDMKVENGLELYLQDYNEVTNKTSRLNVGALMIDEATQLNQGSGRKVLILVNSMEQKRGAVHYILTGAQDSMETFRASNSRFPTLLPHHVNIEDHLVSETFALLKEEIKTTWDGKMKIEGGEDGLYMRIATRRLSKGRGVKGFGNFHAIERLMANVRRRHASRIAAAKDSGQSDIDDMLLTRDDLIGPPPDENVKTCSAWKTLHEMVGLDQVKKEVQSLLERVCFNYKRELSELPTLDSSLNRLFLGNPGTGKTTVAKLYAEILAKSGVLSSSDVIVKTPIDFTSEYIGATATQTKELLNSARGKVLVIDEAYMMYPEHEKRPHSIHTSAIDAIVSDVQGVAGEDRAVLLLGYKDKMETMLRKGNPGLERRFPLSSAFMFEDYTQAELLEIFHKKLSKQGLSAAPDAVDVAMDLLDKARRRPNFGNAGEVDNVVSKAKLQADVRLRDVPLEERSTDLVLQPEDFDPEYKRTETATGDIAALFKDALECEHLVAKLQGYANTCDNLRAMDLQPAELIPFSFVFKGPPGSFKTSAARAFGQVFYDMGLLADSSVVDCSVTDLVAEYCGQTGQKTRDVLDSAIGKVLLIDEAYRLVETSKFGEEAIGELVDAMTKPKYMQKMIIILAGDAEKMNQFLLKYHHLRSRFSEDVIFKPLGVEQSYKLLMRSMSTGNKLPIELGSDIAHWEAQCKRSLKELVNLPTWGNGRDVADVLTKRLVSRVTSKPLQVAKGQKPRLICDGQDFYAELQKLCIERRTLDDAVGYLKGTGVYRYRCA